MLVQCATNQSRVDWNLLQITNQHGSLTFNFVGEGVRHATDVDINNPVVFLFLMGALAASGEDYAQFSEE